LYATPLGHIDGFSFNADVVRVFPDMLKRSIPGYQTIIAQTGLLAERYARAQTRLYDLGCSLGATAFAMGPAARSQMDCEIIAVDNSPAMITQCQTHLAASPDRDRIHLLESDINGVAIERASVVAMNFTLQFIPPTERQALMARIGDGLLPGGALVLPEKIRFEDARQQALHTDMYHAFKQANGYSELEISQKRTALENVLIADTLAMHRERLMQAGFSSVEVWFQCFNFASMIALK